MGPRNAFGLNFACKCFSCTVASLVLSRRNKRIRKFSRVLCGIMRLFLFLLFIVSSLMLQAICKVVDSTSDPSSSDKVNRSKRSVLTKEYLLESRSFFPLFSVPYIVCFFAAKGKWPFIPSFLQLKVSQASRSLFEHGDDYIKSYCQDWFLVLQCHRPVPEPPTTTSTTTEMTTTTEEEEPTTICNCGRSIRPRPTAPSTEDFDMRKFSGNISIETIQATIEFLQSLLLSPSSLAKRNKKKQPIIFKV